MFLLKQVIKLEINKMLFISKIFVINEMLFISKIFFINEILFKSKMLFFNFRLFKSIFVFLLIEFHYVFFNVVIGVQSTSLFT